MTNQPSVGSLFPSGPGDGEHPADAWSTGCSTAGATWTGSGLDGELALAQSPCMFGPAECTTSSEWWEFDLLAVDALPGPGAGSQGLSADGFLYVLDDSWEAGSGCANSSWENTTYRGGTLSVGMTPTGPNAPALLGEGDSTLDWSWDSLDAKYPFAGGLYCYPGAWSSLSATVTWFATTTPREFTASLEWLWAEGGLDSQNGQIGPVGCASEPLSGSILLSEAPAPGATPTQTIEVTFDGAVACDGCGAVALNGSPAGSWCPSMGFASP